MSVPTSCRPSPSAVMTPARSAPPPPIKWTYKRRKVLNSAGNEALVDEKGALHLPEEVDCMEQEAPPHHQAGIKNNSDLSHGHGINVEGCTAFDQGPKASPSASFVGMMGNANKNKNDATTSKTHLRRPKKNYWPKINDKTKPRKVLKSNNNVKPMRDIHESEMPQTYHVAAAVHSVHGGSVYVPQTPEPLDHKGINQGGSLRGENITSAQTKSWRTSSCIRKRSCRRALSFSVKDESDVDAGNDSTAKYKWIFRWSNSDSEVQDFESCIGMKKIISEYKRGKHTSRKNFKALFSLSKKFRTPFKVPRRKRSKRNLPQKILSVTAISFQRGSLDNTLIPYGRRVDSTQGDKYSVKVDMCPNTFRAWNLLMENDVGLDETDEKTKEWLHEETKQLGARFDVFTSCMNLIQGDRRCSNWGGSVLDSVVGVLLTQNVTDILSSSAFMSLAAKYPPKYRRDIEKDSTFSGHESSSSTIQLETEGRKMKTINHWFSLAKEIAIAQAEKRNGKRSKIANQKKKVMMPELQSRKKKGKKTEMPENTVKWDELKQTYCTCKPRSYDSLDAVDWEGVRRAPLEEVSKVIEGRGMNNLIAGRKKDLLDRLVRDHGSLDLEWLRDVPPIKAKDYLMSIDGIGLKSAECIRLLSLGHHAFPVDTNIGRVAVRLGWVPLQPFPDGVLIHLLEKFPLKDKIQQYLWPRLQGLDKEKLFELHYHLITFGKVFCKKKRPNCNACPMKGECRHFASAYASEKLGLPAPNKKARPSSEGYTGYPTKTQSPLLLEGLHESVCEPTVEVPSSPEPEYVETPLKDMEDLCSESDDYIPTIELNTEAFRKNVLMEFEKRNYMPHDISKALVSLTHESASISMRKVSVLRTEHLVGSSHLMGEFSYLKLLFSLQLSTCYVSELIRTEFWRCDIDDHILEYELEDGHPLLAGFREREPDDPCPYLVRVWTTGGMYDFDPKREEKSDHMVLGTILIPCKTANKGFFPLSGTYFQPNEVFADDESSRNPISIPTNLLWNRTKRSLYSGTSAASIFTGVDIQKITYSFRRGFICVRGIDKISGAPRPLDHRFHIRSMKKQDLEE